jgi:hypothetical protein
MPIVKRAMMVLCGGFAVKLGQVLQLPFGD